MATTAPSKNNFVGTIASISKELENSGKKYRIYTIEGATGNKTFVINDKFALRNADLLVLDADVEISFEEVIKDKTHWVDKDSVEHVHTYTGVNVVGVTRVSSKKAKMASLGSIIESTYKKSENLDLTKIYADAFATLLR